MTEKPTEPFTGVHHPSHPGKTFTVTNHRDRNEAIAQLGVETIESSKTLVEENKVRPRLNLTKWELIPDTSKSGVSVWREEVSVDNAEQSSFADQIEQELTASGIK